uniref:Uncharacterized protein n=1 Tax=Hucho hucho TaxID=62062 RepID=A0A4W5QFE3_9TELE
MCCQAAGHVMLKQGYGKIINTASMASLIVPHPQKQLAYNTSKAGVLKLTDTWHRVNRQRGQLHLTVSVCLPCLL